MILQNLLTPNRYSRNQRPLTQPEGIALHHGVKSHYTAMQTRNYFENLKSGKNALYYSTHYIVGSDGEILQCIPEDETANHRGNSAQSRSHLAITLCGDPQSPPSTNCKNALKLLTADLARRHALPLPASLHRHCDLSGSACTCWLCRDAACWQALGTEITEAAQAADYLKKNEPVLSALAAERTGIDAPYFQNMMQGCLVPDPLATLKLLNLLALFPQCPKQSE